MRPSLTTSVYADCPQCQATGRVKSTESVVLDIMRRLALALFREQVVRVELTVSPDVAFHLLNRHRQQLVQLETQHGKAVLVRVSQGGPVDIVQLAAMDARGSVVDAEGVGNLPKPELDTPEDTGAPKRRTRQGVAAEAREASDDPPKASEQPAAADDAAPKKKRPSRRRGGRRRSSAAKSADAKQPDSEKPADNAQAKDAKPATDAEPADSPASESQKQDEPARKKRPSRRRRRRRPKTDDSDKTS